MQRKLFKSDLAQLLAIEQAVHVTPWTEETFKTCFQAGYVGWVIEVDKKIIGFVIISLAEECHVLNLCVARQYQHQGWGRKLLEIALTQAKQQGVHIAYLEVRDSNSHAISLYRSMGFQVVGGAKTITPR